VKERVQPNRLQVVFSLGPYRARVGQRVRNPRLSTLYSRCFTLNRESVRSPTYREASSFATRPSYPRCFTSNHVSSPLPESLRAGGPRPGVDHPRGLQHLPPSPWGSDGDLDVPTCSTSKLADLRDKCGEGHLMSRVAFGHPQAADAACPSKLTHM